MAAGNDEKDNRTNSLTEHHMKSAIDTVLGNPEQNYEEFMGCFIGLKKEDVIAHHTHQLQKMLKKQGNDNDPSQGQRSETEMGRFRGHKPRFDSEEEDIDTEVLDDGIYTPTRQVTDISPGHRFVQMDNFVDDAELLEDDTQGQCSNEEFASSHYESSFSQVDSSTGSPLKLSEDPIRRLEGTEDRKEEKAEPSGAHLELRKCDMKTLPRKAEVEYESSFGIVDSSTTSPLKLSEDLIGRIKGVDDGQDKSSGAPLELSRGCEMKTLPGEAEEEREYQTPLMSDDAVHRTELKMSSRRSLEGVETKEDQQPEASLEMSTDEVQSFSLDMDFDYDNVVLTPKWDSNHGPPGWEPSH